MLVEWGGGGGGLFRGRLSGGGLKIKKIWPGKSFGKSFKYK